MSSRSPPVSGSSALSTSSWIASVASVVSVIMDPPCVGEPADYPRCTCRNVKDRCRAPLLPGGRDVPGRQAASQPADEPLDRVGRLGAAEEVALHGVAAELRELGQRLL